jgi:heme-binding protein
VKTPHLLKRLGVVVGVALALGAVRYARSDANPSAGPNTINTSIHVQVAATSGLDSVLVRSCGDCHSNTMSSHWSSRVPPVSWILARGAREGRKAVNFAEWSSYSPAQQHAFLLASCADAKSGRMPMAAYLRLRPDARLSPREIETICGASR